MPPRATTIRIRAEDIPFASMGHGPLPRWRRHRGAPPFPESLKPHGAHPSLGLDPSSARLDAAPAPRRPHPAFLNSPEGTQPNRPIDIRTQAVARRYFDGT